MLQTCAQHKSPLAKKNSLLYMSSVGDVVSSNPDQAAALFRFRCCAPSEEPRKSEDKRMIMTQAVAACSPASISRPRVCWGLKSLLHGNTSAEY